MPPVNRQLCCRLFWAPEGPPKEGRRPLPQGVWGALAAPHEELCIPGHSFKHYSGHRPEVLVFEYSKLEIRGRRPLTG